MQMLCVHRVYPCVRPRTLIQSTHWTYVYRVKTNSVLPAPDKYMCMFTACIARYISIEESGTGASTGSGRVSSYQVVYVRVHTLTDQHWLLCKVSLLWSVYVHVNCSSVNTAHNETTSVGTSRKAAQVKPVQGEHALTLCLHLCKMRQALILQVHISVDNAYAWTYTKHKHALQVLRPTSSLESALTVPHMRRLFGVSMHWTAIGSINGSTHQHYHDELTVQHITLRPCILNTVSVKA